MSNKMIDMFASRGIGGAPGLITIQNQVKNKEPVQNEYSLLNSSKNTKSDTSAPATIVKPAIPI